MSNEQAELQQGSMPVEKIMQTLRSDDQDKKPRAQEAVEAPSGYLTYLDICILFGDPTWSTLDIDLAAAFARQLVLKHNLPVLELSSGKFLINYNFR